MKWRIVVLWATALLIVAWTGLLVIQKEQVLAEGKPILLKLAPVDPRSLIQGDYMRLRYDLSPDGAADWPRQGTLVATLDQQNVVQSVRLYDGQQTLAANEHLLHYHTQGFDIMVAANSFLFQEGTAEAYANARYGEVRASPDGDSLLVGLRDEQLQPLGKPVP